MESDLNMLLRYLESTGIASDKVYSSSGSLTFLLAPPGLSESMKIDKCHSELRCRHLF